jgi:hypothetical protein
MISTASATYTKLRDGSWGLRIVGSATPGSQISVAKKSGERKMETVGRVVFAGNGVTLATILSAPSNNYAPRKTYGSHRPGRCRECGAPGNGSCCA